jgi:hypothetical protein
MELAQGVYYSSLVLLLISRPIVLMFSLRDLHKVIVIGFIEHLQIVITSNYSATDNSHTLQFTTARTESSQSAVFTSGRSPAPGSRPRRLAAVSRLSSNGSGPRYIASARTAQRTPLPTALLLRSCRLRPLPNNGCCLESHY